MHTEGALNGVSMLVAGGNTMAISALYEFPIGRFDLGASFTFKSKTATKTTVSGQATELDDDAANQYAVEIYAPIKKTPPGLSAGL